MKYKRGTYIGIVVVLILLIPLYGNNFIDGWNWGIFDFISALVILYGTGLLIDLAVRKIKNKYFRVITVIAIVLALLVVWVEIAPDGASRAVQPLYSEKSTSNISTGYQAATSVKEKYPEYGDYPSDNLPPKRIEVLETSDGWRVGMYIEGSGLPGILKANCFLVTRSGIVTETGLFQGEGPAKSINLLTCTPKE